MSKESQRTILERVDPIGRGAGPIAIYRHLDWISGDETFALNRPSVLQRIASLKANGIDPDASQLALAELNTVHGDIA